jgi:hypothetical protein
MTNKISFILRNYSLSQYFLGIPQNKTTGFKNASGA